MSKTIIFCADGTWNGPPAQSDQVDASDDDKNGSSKDITNVVKLFANLAGTTTAESIALRNEQEKAELRAPGDVRQIAKYIHGVGDTDNKIRKMLQGTLGRGVIARIVRGYTFVSREYRDGDAIVLLGFSRGAYTARALAGMIARVGLLDPGAYDPADHERAYALGVAAWQKYRKESLEQASRLTRITNAVLDLVANFHAEPLPANALRPVAGIDVVGVWDTVGSLGVPLYEADGGRLDVFRFADSALSRKVACGLHAMSIDELRGDFPLTSWDVRDGVEQVWFAGAHSDVGGGYPDDESQLSDEALGWMMKKLAARGVRFAPVLPSPPRASAGDELIHRPWEKVPFLARMRKARSVPGDAVLHSSVVARFSKMRDYAPESMKEALGRQPIERFAVDDTRWT